MRNEGSKQLAAITKLSELVTLAVNDARGLDRTVYVPRYNEWHGRRYVFDGDDHRLIQEAKCAVCLAGAVIAGRELAGIQQTICPSDVADSYGDYRLYRRLMALDSVRLGNFYAAAQQMIDSRNEPIALDCRLAEALRAIDAPPAATFDTWSEFEQHLTDLEQRVIPALEAAGI
ncbi:MAG: hypothetical protein OXC11_12170 [Rhodospirillales bacterium]|nr:hypothetical protein [Rhodospirillales bacterium]